MQDPHYPRYQNHQDSGYQDYQQGYYPDEQAEPALDPAMERVRRKMIRLLAVSIGVMLIGLMAVLVAVVYKINRAPETPPAEEARSDIPGQAASAPVKPEPPKLIESQINLTPGTRLLSQSLSGNELSLETLLPDGGTELIIYDYRESRIIGRIKLGNVE
ncbi:hypothetical protein ACRRRS_09765 [Brucella anthropi]|jgi:hypothetical protein|uniref:Fimbrial protein n=1 Tax=Brucella anthropi TaxID=529 RepID=A0A6I0DKI1_BRUAN|nr:MULTISPECIES: hypothetical protein [Brucella/Ochrobactrum group]MCR5943209.1 hypothetical protein [Ochrobactrum sp. XJ1]QOD63107.1 hypothetical protein HGK82_09920 [Ochrobactrum sp. MT180101]QTN03509.1 hypothetical protein GTN27_10150 [Ochrobactrum sp. EEELCW01]KAB2731974.1 hypothetical protein F9K89_22655 [Brucella anthropi]KAB2755441.1 hypothetical protein F9K81_19975 [Brucella anthropi]